MLDSIERRQRRLAIASFLAIERSTPGSLQGVSLCRCGRGPWQLQGRLLPPPPPPAPPPTHGRIPIEVARPDPGLVAVPAVARSDSGSDPGPVAVPEVVRPDWGPVAVSEFARPDPGPVAVSILFAHPLGDKEVGGRGCNSCRCPSVFHASSMPRVHASCNSCRCPSVFHAFSMLRLHASSIFRLQARLPDGLLILERRT